MALRLSNFARGCGVTAIRRSLDRRHPGHYFSSFDGSAPKFPVPEYQGRSHPIPVATIPPSSTKHGQQEDALKQHQLDIANAIRPHHQSQTPVLLQNLHKKCDAMYFWPSLEYWRVAVGGETPVEVEVGKAYNTGGNRMPMIFGDYLDYLEMCKQHEGDDWKLHQQGYGERETNYEVAYLAQHELFPQVMNDIPIPQLCDDDRGEYNVGEGKLYHCMIWMGPRHTVSPLHFDPLDNILMQVVGWKRVLLFPPDKLSDGNAKESSDSENEKVSDPSWHYAGGKDNQYNTSAVDVENPDMLQFPNFKSAPTPYECLLGPGDGLYIPKKWWHHVRSLETSVSANVWWR